MVSDIVSIGSYLIEQNEAIDMDTWIILIYAEFELIADIINICSRVNFITFVGYTFGADALLLFFSNRKHSAKDITWIYRLSLAATVIHFIQPLMKITSHKCSYKYPNVIAFGPAVGILFALHFSVDFFSFFLHFVFSCLIVLYWWINVFDALFLLILCIRTNSIQESCCSSCSTVQRLLWKW